MKDFGITGIVYLVLYLISVAKIEKEPAFSFSETNKKPDTKFRYVPFSISNALNGRFPLAALKTQTKALK